MGADSHVSTKEGELLDRGVPKIFKNDNLLLAASGDMRAVNILPRLTIPKVREDKDEWMYRDFIPALYQEFKLQAGMQVGNQGLECGSIFLAVDGELFEIRADLHFYRVKNFSVTGYVYFAQGFLTAIGRKLYRNPKKYIIQTLAATSKTYPSAVGGPFFVEFQPKPSNRS